MTTHLGVPIGRGVTLDNIFESHYNKALDRISTAKTVVSKLSVLNRILFVNVFIISLFSYHALFFIVPKEILDSIRRLTHTLVGGAYTYNSLICLDSIFSIRPPLKDLWAFNISLLASRSSLISSTANYHRQSPL